jgi:two-component system response regulator FimZ (fimbrial Z protein)
MSIKIIIADDHAVVLAGTSMIIKSGIPEATITMVKSYPELLEQMSKADYDVLLLDINMPGSKNLKMIAELKNINTQTKLIVFTSYDEHAALEYIKAGAHGYINKLYPEEEILYAIHAVIEQGYYYSQKLAKLAMNNLNAPNKTNDPEKLLTKREFEVYKLLYQGLGNLEIANGLDIHMSTVSTLKKRIFGKLKVANITELIKTYHLKD